MLRVCKKNMNHFKVTRRVYNGNCF